MTTTDGQGASEEERERYQTDTRQPHSYVGFVTQEEHIGKLRHLEARVRREVAAEYVSLMVAHDTALTELISLRAEVAAQRPVVAAVARDFGQQLRAARLERGFTQRDAAVWLGLSPQFYNDMEHGRRTPGDDLADRIEERFGVVYLTPRMARLLALAQSAPGSAPDAGQG